MTNRKNTNEKPHLTPLASDHSRLLRAEGQLVLARREIDRLRAELADAQRGEQLRREALFQLLDQKDERIHELEEELGTQRAKPSPP